MKTLNYKLVLLGDSAGKLVSNINLHEKLENRPV